MSPHIFLLLNLCLAFYNVGTIWAHEVDTFRTWKLLGAQQFHHVQEAHWQKLPYWVLGPVGIGFVGALVLVWFHPAGSPTWAIWVALISQGVCHVLTGAFWGRWQAKLSKDERGPQSPYLAKIVATHWVRTLLVNLYAGTLLAWVLLSRSAS